MGYLDQYVIGRAQEERDGKIIRVNICYDPNPDDPRSWDHLGTMVCFHKRYNLGDQPGRKHDFETPHQFMEFMEENEGRVLALPLYLMDHSGLTISVDDTVFRVVDSVGWDWGQVGWIYTTYEDIRKWFNVKRVTRQVLNRAKEVLIAEVEEYNKYLQGAIIGFVIEEHDPVDCWQVVDSCFGFTEIEYLLEYIPEEYRELAEQAWDNRS